MKVKTRNFQTARMSRRQKASENVSIVSQEQNDFKTNKLADEKVCSAFSGEVELGV